MRLFFFHLQIAAPVDAPSKLPDEVNPRVSRRKHNRLSRGEESSVLVFLSCHNLVFICFSKLLFFYFIFRFQIPAPAVAPQPQHARLVLVLDHENSVSTKPVLVQSSIMGSLVSKSGKSVSFLRLFYC